MNKITGKPILSNFKKKTKMKTNPAMANILTTILSKTVLKNPLPCDLNAFVIIKLPINTLIKQTNHPVIKGIAR